jgi:hypothetical protein
MHTDTVLQEQMVLVAVTAIPLVQIHLQELLELLEGDHQTAELEVQH